ncbi:MAG: TonB-dependent receptor [Acidobacteria bacterium]|nr:TonB-dependent receptor [Acidobacteriota bacterium]
MTVVGCVAVPSQAQTTGATLQGTVADEQGGLLPGASVTVTNVETGVARTLTTDERGWYRAAALQPGAYALKVELAGFVTYVRSGLTLTIGQEATVGVTLKLASVAETITVSAESPLVETTKSTIGTTITRNQLDALPLAGRNFTILAQTAPGITGVGGGGVNAAGQLSRNNSFLIDGASNDDNVVASTRGGFSLEAVREYVVMANQFPAEFGQASGAIVSVVTRSGTNDLQGRGFFFRRDDSMDAQDPFSKAQGSGKAPFNQNRVGGFVGGPILRDRMHYFSSYEGIRTGETSVITVPQVPVSDREAPHDTKGNQYFIKVDNQFGRKQSLAVRYRMDWEDDIGSNIGRLDTRERGEDVERRDQDVVANHTTVLTARALNEARFQFSRRRIEWDTTAYSPLGTPAVDRPAGRWGKASNMPQGRRERRLQFIDNFSYSRGQHDLKTGFDISLIGVKSFFFNNVDGTFRFATDRPFDPNDLSTYPTQFTQNIGDAYLTRRNYLYSFFVQDTWRARDNLTFNLGLRYDTETAFTEAAGVPDDRNNFGPRLGLVWDPFGTGRTAVRGGYGIYYDQAFLNITGNIMLARRFVGVTIVNPGYPNPYSRGSVSPPSAPSTTIASPDVHTPNTSQFTLGFKRELAAGLAISIDTVGSRGRNLFNAPDVNYPDPITKRRPDPTFLRVTQYQTTGNSWYNALLIGLERRRTEHGPSWGVSYTLSRQLRDVEDFGFQAQDMNNRAAEKGPAGNDRRHQFVANFTWALPGGFQIGTLVQARSGLPWNVTTGIDNNGDTIINDRPDLIHSNGPRTDPSTYASVAGRVGNLGRNANIGPRFLVVDARASKFLRLGTRRFEAFVEAFNLTNRTNLGLPNGNLRAATFGASTGLASSATPRQLELGFRFDF